MAEPAVAAPAAATDPVADPPVSVDPPVGDPTVDPAKADGGDPPPVGDPAVDPTKDDGGEPTPGSYTDFTLPEGVTLDETVLEKATPIFKELGLNQEQAQKLVDLQAEMVKEGDQSRGDAFDQLIEGWQTDSKNDKEFGGEMFDENMATARLAVEKFGTPEFKQLMEDHGVGSHPEMVRFMLKIGTLLKEDVPGSLSGAPSEKKSRADIMYPKS